MAGIQREIYCASTLIKTAGNSEEELSSKWIISLFDVHVLTDKVYFLFGFESSLAVGSKSGYKLFSLNSVEKLEEIYEYGKCLLFAFRVRERRQS